MVDDGGKRVRDGGSGGGSTPRGPIGQRCETTTTTARQRTVDCADTRDLRRRRRRPDAARTVNLCRAVVACHLLLVGPGNDISHYPFRIPGGVSGSVQ